MREAFNQINTVSVYVDVNDDDDDDMKCYLIYEMIYRHAVRPNGLPLNNFYNTHCQSKTLTGGNSCHN